jgi:hypothetical protein
MSIRFRFAAFVIFSLTILPTRTFCQSDHADAVQELFAAANHERASQGLLALKLDAALTRAAEQHAERLAREHALSHQFPDEPDLATRLAHAGARFTSAAENIAYGQSAAVIQESWMKSPPHRANLLDKDSDSIGIAVSESGEVLFAVEDFSHAVPSLTIDDQEKQVGMLLLNAELRLLDEHNDARRACVQPRGFTAKHQPLAIVRYETTDLGSFPDILVSKIQSGRYHSAAVGACASLDSPFSMFRVAVLLY